MEHDTSQPQEEQTAPSWFVNDKINENKFCEAFLTQYPMLYINKIFYTPDERITDVDVLKQKIYHQIRPYCSMGISRKISALVELLQSAAHSDPLPLEMDRIHVANGTLFLNGVFSEQKDFCNNRLPVRYNPNAPSPDHWLRFLDQLLYSEDIPTLQEFMGYCLIPSTKGQKMLFLTGKGGEGKSRVGIVMKALLGIHMNVGSIAKVETNQFGRADLEHRLVMVDDDLKLEALPQTNNIKTIVTAELPMDVERKGQQSYQAQLYVRFLAFGNGTMRSLYDRSDGFYRRQLILTVRERDRNRTDDPFLAQKLCEEAEGIFLWCLEGLHRLLDNRYQFTISQRTATNMTEAIRDGNNVVEFMESTGYIEFRADREITSKELYEIYTQWCEDNAYKPLSARSLGNYLSQHEQDYHLEHTNTIRNHAGKRVWGYVGICAVT